MSGTKEADGAARLDPVLQQKAENYNEAQRWELAGKLNRWARQLMAWVNKKDWAGEEEGWLALLEKRAGHLGAKDKRKLGSLYCFWAIQLERQARDMEAGAAARKVMATMGRRARGARLWRN